MWLKSTKYHLQFEIVIYDHEIDHSLYLNVLNLKYEEIETIFKEVFIKGKHQQQNQNKATLVNRLPLSLMLSSDRNYR